MEKIFGALIITAISVIIFLLGYNATFNTEKTHSEFTSRSGYKKGSKMYKAVSRESNKFWMKIGGIGAMLFALVLFLIVINGLVKLY